MDQITEQEMLAGSQPTRLERIAYTPLSEVLAKSSWDDIDVEILVANRFSLDAETLAKLGITNPTPLSAEEVAAKTADLGPVPEVNIAPAPAAPAPEVTPEVTPEATPETPTPAAGLPTDTAGGVDNVGA